MSKRETLILLLFAATALIVAVVSVFCGPTGFAVFKDDVGTWLTVLEWRGLRTATGFFVGAALSTAGCVLQTILRNPLAEPYILGISSGASVGAALVMAAGLGFTMPLLLPAASFVMALLTVILILAISRKAGGSSIPQNLILTGVVTGSVLSSILTLIITFSRTHTIRSLTWWLLGNLQCASWLLLAVCAVPIVLGILFLIAETQTLNALLLGPENAHGLGINTRRSIPLLTAAATLITACAVAISGIIGFAGLIVPHILRTRLGSNHRTLLPLAALGGGIFLMACDIVGRMAAAPHEIPVGVITALTGGPFFLYLLTRRKHD
ncbi:MAG: iron ABC transporter permease [Kiritimatiellia bacterium]